jgi:hypothetical protein
MDAKFASAPGQEGNLKAGGMARQRIGEADHDAAGQPLEDGVGHVGGEGDRAAGEPAQLVAPHALLVAAHTAHMLAMCAAASSTGQLPLSVSHWSTHEQTCESWRAALRSLSVCGTPESLEWQTSTAIVSLFLYTLATLAGLLATRVCFAREEGQRPGDAGSIRHAVTEHYGPDAWRLCAKLLRLLAMHGSALAVMTAVIEIVYRTTLPRTCSEWESTIVVCERESLVSSGAERISHAARLVVAAVQIRHALSAGALIGLQSLTTSTPYIHRQA